MELVSSTPAAVRRLRYLTVAAVAAALVVAGVLRLHPGAAVALWVVLGGALVGHWAGRRASDCSVLADLRDVRVADLATPLAAIPARSASPLLDLARIRAAGGGMVVIDGVTKVLPERRVEQFDVEFVLPGCWAELALPCRELGPDVTADRLRRLPDEDEVWVVRTRGGVRMLSGDGLRAAAAAARGSRREQVPTTVAPSRRDDPSVQRAAAARTPSHAVTDGGRR